MDCRNALPRPEIKSTRTNPPFTVPANFPKGRVKACTSCRQVKLKCNARKLFPARCSRCETHTLDCKMDPTFRSMLARHNLEEVFTNPSNLQEPLRLNQHPTASGSAQNLRGIANTISTQVPLWRPRQQKSPGFSSTDDSSNSLSPPEDCVGGRQWLVLGNPQEEGSWPIGNMIIHSDTVSALFEHFDKKLDPHIPILEPCTSLNMLYQTSAILFWTIVFVSCRENPLYK